MNNKQWTKTKKKIKNKNKNYANMRGSFAKNNNWIKIQIKNKHWWLLRQKQQFSWD